MCPGAIHMAEFFAPGYSHGEQIDWFMDAILFFSGVQGKHCMTLRRPPPATQPSQSAVAPRPSSCKLLAHLLHLPVDADDFRPGNLSAVVPGVKV